MVSTLYVGLKARIENYASIFIGDFLTNKEDFDATNDDHIRAVAFRILSSAAIEEYVEERCKQVARKGVERLQQGLPTTAGRSLVVWGIARNSPGCVPVREDDVAEHMASVEQILDGYMKSVQSNHGLNSRDFRNLLNPVGLRSHQVPPGILDRLQALSDRRDPAVHATVKKATGRLGPSIEHKQVTDILTLLQDLDSELEKVQDNFPVLHLTA